MTTQSYAVTGMTCGHCAAAVTREVSAVAGVQGVEVDVAAGSVAVTADHALDDSLISAAVDEAGYTLTGRL